MRGELSQFVDDLVVTEQLISTILETPVSEQLFLEQLQVCDSSWLNKNAITILQVLDHKIAFLKEQSFREARGAADVKDVLEKLKVRRAFIYQLFSIQKNSLG